MLFFPGLIIKLFVLLSIIFIDKETELAQDLLTTNNKIPANALVVEGWLPDYALPIAYEEYVKGSYDYIITTGLGFTSPLRMYTNSFLIFKPYDNIRSDTIPGQQNIQLKTESSLVNDDSCRFRLWINNTMVSTFYANKYSLILSYKWYGKLSDIDSILIQYDSDRLDDRGDRNLIIYDVKINNQSLVFKNASIFMDKGRPFGVKRRNLFARSYAELAANYFLERGIPKEKTIVISKNSHTMNRTLGSALALKNWLRSQPNGIKDINLVSQDYHSTRSFMVYRKLLTDNYRVGIISIPLNHQKYTKKETRRMMVKELIAYTYYTLFVFPVIWIMDKL
jgi:DUF218 domain